MKKNIELQDKFQAFKLDHKKDKHLEDEYLRMKNSLGLVGKEERFTFVVQFIKICKKLQITPPDEYLAYYSRTKSLLSTEMKSLQKKINISQINNENYKHLEERMNLITSKLGIGIN